MRYKYLAVVLLAATPALGQTTGVQQAATIQVQNAWARATTPAAQAGGVFLTITDRGAPDRMLSAATPVAATAELHETIDDHGVMKMRPVPALPLPTGTAVELKPGSYHIMLMGLKQQLKPGDSFPIVLNFEHAPPVTVSVTVGQAGAAGPTPHH